VDAFGTMKVPGGEFECLRITQNNVSITYTPQVNDTNYIRGYHFYSMDLVEVNISGILEDQFELTTVDVSGFKYSIPEGQSGIGETGMAAVARLGQNYPNPVTGSTVIPYSVISATNITLTVLDHLGRQVAVLVDAKQAPGAYQVRFNAANLPAGLYMVRLTAGDYSETMKMTRQE
jgi:hypothetical protein